MKELNNIVLNKIEGGCFAYDAGWFLGNLVTGGFSNPASTTVSLIKYGTHYGTEHNH